MVVWNSEGSGHIYSWISLGRNVRGRELNGSLGVRIDERREWSSSIERQIRLLCGEG